VLARRLSQWGISTETQVVAYDDSGGSMAARLWWLLRWLGHDDVAVLDAGWQAWQAAGYPVATGEERRDERHFEAHVRPELAVTAAAVQRVRSDPGWRIVDARGADRYRGENETIDPVAGHIPGARSAPWADNLDSTGRFRSPTELLARYQAVVEGVPPDRIVAYCGSGVTAAHNALAMAHAGLGDIRLYPGSWSEWITDPARPVATGDEG
jgi:thiosulfate/3-mercaptopyruvate sulfurtransferase